MIEMEVKIMAIKMIVTDLDGTFYHRDFTYDRERFSHLYKQMEEKDIRFVVASGNQYYQLISFFDHPEEMTFVSENGGYIISLGEELFSTEIDPKIYKNILDILNQTDGIHGIVSCGKKAAYVLNTMSDDLYKMFNLYYYKLERIEDLYDVDDTILKMSISVDEESADDISQLLNQRLKGSLVAIVSGHGCIDFIVPGVHKGAGIQQLMKIWDIESHEIMAFGDAENDTEMLKLAGYGFVMKNGTETLKKRIQRICPYTNDEDGELRMIEEYFENPDAFLKKYQ